jgi:hypothetical protein
LNEKEDKKFNKKQNDKKELFNVMNKKYLNLEYKLAFLVKEIDSNDNKAGKKILEMKIWIDQIHVKIEEF